MITITRSDLESSGLRIAQTGHAIAGFCLTFKEQANDWNNQYLICLAVESEKDLIRIFQKLEAIGIDCYLFFESDLNDELTSISFYESGETLKITKNLKTLN